MIQTRTTDVRTPDGKLIFQIEHGADGNNILLKPKHCPNIYKICIEEMLRKIDAGQPVIRASIN